MNAGSGGVSRQQRRPCGKGQGAVGAKKYFQNLAWGSLDIEAEAPAAPDWVAHDRNHGDRANCVNMKLSDCEAVRARSIGRIARAPNMVEPDIRHVIGIGEELASGNRD